MDNTNIQDKTAINIHTTDKQVAESNGGVDGYLMIDKLGILVA